MGKQWKLAPVNGTPDRKLASIDWQEMYLRARELEIGEAGLFKRNICETNFIKQCGESSAHTGYFHCHVLTVHVEYDGLSRY